jgi:competence protein ComEC
MILAGILRDAAQHFLPVNDIARQIPRGFVHLYGKVVGDVEQDQTRIKCTMDVLSISKDAGGLEPCCGRILSFIACDNPQLTLFHGDVLEVEGTLSGFRPERNPGGFNADLYYTRKQIHARLVSRHPRAWRVHETSGSQDIPARLAQACRLSFFRVFQPLMPSAETSLLAGIVLGVHARIPPVIQDDFAVTGSSHIVAASGMNVGMTALLITLFLRPLHLPRRYVWRIMFIALFFYTLVCGASPSIVRADIMASLFLLAKMLDRDADAGIAIAASAFLLLLIQPEDLFDIGFQLTYATLLPIIALLPSLDVLQKIDPGKSAARFTAIISRMKIAAVSTMMITFAAQAGSLPLTARYFNQISFAGLAANALILPCLTLLMGIGFTLWFTSSFAHIIVLFLSRWVLSPFLCFIIGTVHLFSTIPNAAIPVPSPGWGLILLYYVGLFAAILRCNIWIAEMMPHQFNAGAFDRGGTS